MARIYLYNCFAQPHPKHIIMIRPKTKQQGVVLVITMVMLVLLILIGTTASKVSGLQELMTGNFKNNTLAFEAAESALRAAETAINGNINGFQYITNPVANFWDTSFWQTEPKVVTLTNNALTGIASSPKYVIEKITPLSSAANTCGGSLEVGQATSDFIMSWYKVTARGTGGTDNAVVILQTIVYRC